MEDKPVNTSSDGQQQNRGHRDPSPWPFLFEVYFYLGMAGGDEGELFPGHQVYMLCEPISTTGDCNDVAMILGSLTQGFSQHKDIAAKVGLLDKGVRPDHLHQIVLRDYRL